MYKTCPSEVRRALIELIRSHHLVSLSLSFFGHAVCRAYKLTGKSSISVWILIDMVNCELKAKLHRKRTMTRRSSLLQPRPQFHPHLPLTQSTHCASQARGSPGHSGGTGVIRSGHSKHMFSVETLTRAPLLFSSRDKNRDKHINCNLV
jgi:hypothetical protein